MKKQHYLLTKRELSKSAKAKKTAKAKKVKRITHKITFKTQADRQMFLKNKAKVLKQLGIK